MKTFEKYVASGGDEIPADREREVLDEITRLRKLVGSLDIVAPAGSVVLIDGIKRGILPVPGLIKVTA